MTNEERNFRWAYQLLMALAKRCLAETNTSLEDKREWPAGQEWDELVGSSQSIFLRQARDEAGIDHDEFLAPLRSSKYNVDDLCGT